MPLEHILSTCTEFLSYGHVHTVKNQIIKQLFISEIWGSNCGEDVIMVFWAMMSHRLTGIYPCSEELYYLYIHHYPEDTFIITYKTAQYHNTEENNQQLHIYIYDSKKNIYYKTMIHNLTVLCPSFYLSGILSPFLLFH